MRITKRKSFTGSVGIAASSLVIGWGFSPSAVEACSCLPVPRMQVAWPVAGTSGVDLTASVVVARYAWPVVKAQLEATDGTIIPLALTSSFPIAAVCSGDLSFLRPTKTLAPDTTYTITFDATELPAEPVPVYSASSFTTAAEAPQPVAPSFTIESFYVANDAKCVPSQGESCADMVDVSFTGHDLGGSSSWLRIQHSSDTRGGQLIGINALAPRRFAHLSILPADDCVLYTRLDGDGEVVETGSLCDWTKCAVSSLVSEAWNCLPHGWSSEVWESISEDSCSDPPRVSYDPTTKSWQVGPNPAHPDAGIDDAGDGEDEPDSGSKTDGAASSKGRSGACDIGMPANRSAHGSWLILALGVLLHFVRRTRA